MNRALSWITLGTAFVNTVTNGTLRSFVHSFRTCESIGLCRLRHVVNKRLKDIKKAKVEKHELVLKSPQGPEVKVKHVKGKCLLNFCANNYLGLANHPDVVEAARKALCKYGNGLSSVRFICGTQKIHKKLEKRLSKFHNMEDTILYSSCFDANTGLFEALFSSEDAVFSDANNHASIIDGLRLCKAKKYRYPHRDMKILEQMLCCSSARLKVIVTDGVFSMDGTMACIARLRQLADCYYAVLVIDDSHGTAVLGGTGRGTEEHCGCRGAADIVTSTLGKALGGAGGGYVTGPRHVVKMLRNVSRPYLFSNSLSPASVAAGIKALKLVNKCPQFRVNLCENTQKFREGLTKAGFVVGGENHPICPIMVGDARKAAKLASGLIKRGIFVVPFSYPVVPKGAARVRAQVSAAHTSEDIKEAVKAFKKVGRKIGLIKKIGKKC